MVPLPGVESAILAWRCTDGVAGRLSVDHIEGRNRNIKHFFETVILSVTNGTLEREGVHEH